jgi:ribosomal protein S18 acetylase RimI-like enzyme
MNNPLRHTNRGWYWGSVGPQPTRAKMTNQVRAIYASGYQGNPINRKLLDSLKWEFAKPVKKDGEKRYQIATWLDGQLIGLLTYGIYGIPVRLGVYSIDIAPPKYRHQGIGQAMINSMLKRHSKIKMVELNSRPEAIGFWKGLGFEKLKRESRSHTLRHMTLERNPLTSESFVQDKLGSIPTFSMPRGVPSEGGTCPGASPWCKGNCYAIGGQFPMHKDLYYGNYLESLRPDFVDKMIEEIRSRNQNFIRLHVCGDFYSTEYINKWYQIAKALPGRRFLAYTRSWRVPSLLPALNRLRYLPNFKLYGSTDKSTGPPPPGWPEAAIDRSYLPNAYACWLRDSKQFCRQCQYCWRLDTGNVVFMQKPKPYPSRNPIDILAQVSPTYRNFIESTLPRFKAKSDGNWNAGMGYEDLFGFLNEWAELVFTGKKVSDYRVNALYKEANEIYQRIQEDRHDYYNMLKFGKQLKAAFSEAALHRSRLNKIVAIDALVQSQHYNGHVISEYFISRTMQPWGNGPYFNPDKLVNSILDEVNQALEQKFPAGPWAAYNANPMNQDLLQSLTWSHKLVRDSEFHGERQYEITANKNNRWIGGVGYIIRYKTPNKAYIHTMKIDPEEYRRQGIGKLLFEMLLAKHPQINEVELISVSASVDFWKRMGFVLENYDNRKMLSSDLAQMTWRIRI